MENRVAESGGVRGGFIPSFRHEGIGDQLRDLWHEARNRLLASPRFQRWAAGFPLTRGLAARRAQGLFDLVAGFVYSQILLAVVRLDLVSILAEEASTAPGLAARLGLTDEAARCLLEAAAALGIAEPRRQGRFALGPLGAVLAGNPAIAAMIAHHDMFYADLADPVALLRGKRGETALARFWPYARGETPAPLSGAEVAAYGALMAASQPLIAGDILDAYPCHRHRVLLDVGGGEGAFVVAAAARAPALRLILFDLPAVAERARMRFAAAGLEGRAVACCGDFLADELPAGADLATLVRVLHDHDDASALRLLRALRRALSPGARLLVAEPMAGVAGAERVAAYFHFYLLAMGRGRPRSPAALAALLESAGFHGVRRLPTRRPLLVGALLAEAR